MIIMNVKDDNFDRELRLTSKLASGKKFFSFHWITEYV